MWKQSVWTDLKYREVYYNGVMYRVYPQPLGTCEMIVVSNRTYDGYPHPVARKYGSVA